MLGASRGDKFWQTGNRGHSDGKLAIGFPNRSDLGARTHDTEFARVRHTHESRHGS